MRYITKAMTLVCVAGVMLVGCSPAASEQAAVATPAVRVRAQTLERGDLSQTTGYTGRIMPNTQVYVIPKLSGEVTATFAEVGDTVKKGDLLFTLDDADARLAFQNSQLAYEQSKVAYELALLTYDQTLNGSGVALEEQKLRDAVTAAQHTYAQATEAMKLNHEYETSDFNKYRRAYRAALAAWQENPGDDTLAKLAAAEKNYSDIVDDMTGYSADLLKLNQSFDALETAMNNLKIYQNQTLDERIQAAEMTLQNAEMTYQRAEVGYQQAQSGIENYRITAPVDGVIEQKNVTVRNLAFTAVSAASLSTAAYIISAKDDLAVNFNVAAEVAMTLQPGDTVELEYRDKTYHAEVTEIGVMIDASSGLFPVKARLVDAPANLPTGITVKLTATTGSAQGVLLVPLSAVYYDDGKPYVYVAQNGVAIKTPIELGIISGSLAELKSGLTPNDHIITTWSPNLNDGILVDVIEEA